MIAAGTPAHRGKAMAEAEFRRLWADKRVTLAEIGRRLGITESAAHCRGMVRKLPRRGHGKEHRSPIIPDRQAEFTALYLGRVKNADMGEYFGVHPDTITKTARRLGLPPRGKSFGHYAITLAAFNEARIAAAWAADAAKTKAAMVRAGMHPSRVGG